MLVRKWSRTENSDFESESTITVFDSGIYWGELQGGEWSCWRIQIRLEVESEIHEFLEPMPQDWVPFLIFSEETIPMRRVNATTYEIPGWRIECEIIEIPPLPLPPPSHCQLLEDPPHLEILGLARLQ